MACFGQNHFPEQCPATVNEWATPLEGDDAKISRLCPNTNLKLRTLRLTYNANCNRWDLTAFHSKVDKQGGGIVLCMTKSSLKCGGKNPRDGLDTERPGAA